MAQPVVETVTVSFADGVTTVDKPRVRLYYDHPQGPHSVRWRMASYPPGTARLKVLWAQQSPFGQTRMRKGMVHGTSNSRLPGRYRYAVLFVDAAGQVLGGVDPEVINEPHPRIARRRSRK